MLEQKRHQLGEMTGRELAAQRRDVLGEPAPHDGGNLERILKAEADERVEGARVVAVGGKLEAQAGAPARGLKKKSTASLGLWPPGGQRSGELIRSGKPREAGETAKRPPGGRGGSGGEARPGGGSNRPRQGRARPPPQSSRLRQASRASRGSRARAARDGDRRR